ncbi:uncharacterized protein N7483_006112 [Penicillium malachiteum]|uniref:uncharacterized protein n=1 Tax=Penicillium malachiteum TaxID=1324776 RepID=UPI002547EC43|nr:uncharacterized protein N7483_006112 [Penicillium malachiteum]KAJ5731604.1 hypothetical protein N7483_006112 [Penicillium malachiteum]
MPRRSSRPGPTEAPGSAKSAPKRRASARLSATPSEVKRVKSNSALSAKSTSKKSKYFKPESSAEPEESPSESETGGDSDSGSAYEEKESGSESSPTPESEVEEEAESESALESDGEEESSKPKTKSKQTQRRGRADSGSTGAPKAKELWRVGVRTGLEPGEEVIFTKPKARGTGGIPYEDETLHPNTKLFLQDLAENNDRQWLKAHDADFRAAKKDFETFVETLSGKITEVDETIPELPMKDLIFRIHRDVRFSKNPLPYKIHFSAAWSRTGKKGPYAAYYVHFQPGSSFVGCGLWNPEADALASLREDIDQNVDQWKEVLRAPDMRREFLGGVGDDDVAAVKAFAHHNKESALKTKPKGWESTHHSIELLRLRSFTIGRPITDDDFMAADVQERIVSLIGVMEPFVTYINSVVMPDQ